LWTDVAPTLGTGAAAPTLQQGAAGDGGGSSGGASSDGIDGVAAGVLEASGTGFD
jgi:hypothetical protein